MERGESPARGQTVSEARSTRLITLMAWLVSTVWLIALIQPTAAALASRSAGRMTLSLAGLALFLTIYLWATGSDAREFAMTTPPAPKPLWRRALPAALITTLAFAMTLGLDIAWGTLFIFAAVSAARRLPIRPALIATALLALVPFTGTASRGAPTLATALQNAGLIAVVGVTVIGMRWSFITNRELRIARRELARLAITEERLRFARDLHDLLGHTLSLITLKSELAGRLVATAPERAQVELTGIERAARQALRDVRAAVAGYRETTLAGEIAATRELLAAAGIACSIQGEDIQAPPQIEAALAWAMREGCANTVRHSRAHSCAITLSASDGWFTLLIEDDGAAGAPEAGEAPGNGLRGLAERVNSLGGALQTGPRLSGGYRLRVALPASERQDAAISESPLDPLERSATL